MADRVEVVLSHPNRWSKREQDFLKKAAVQAGLVTKNKVAQRLHFVEEAEAAMCYTVKTNAILEAGMQVCRRLFLQIWSVNIFTVPRATSLVPSLRFVMPVVQLSTALHIM